MQRIPCKNGEANGYVEFDGVIIIPGNLGATRQSLFTHFALRDIEDTRSEISALRLADIDDEQREQAQFIMIIQPEETGTEPQLLKLKPAARGGQKETEVFYLRCNNGHFMPYTIEI